MGKVVPLTTHNAEIKTATVEIQSLTITGKQVTLAVFRQLIEAPLINHDGSLAGVPWGTVNYCPGKTCPEPDHFPHWHVVWQQGTELRRSAVRKKAHHEPFANPDQDKYLTAQIIASLRGEAWLQKFSLDRAINEGRTGRNSRLLQRGVEIEVLFPPTLSALQEKIAQAQRAEEDVRGNATT
jgi:hypothetical protein